MKTIFAIISVTSMLLLLEYPIIEANLFAMRPLSARQVYRLLHESGRSDAIPQGRIITQGLAAMTGFALGLTKGLGTAFIYDVITANITEPNSATNTGVNGNMLRTQEVCFNSRSARSLEEAEAIAEAYSRDDGKEQLKVRPSEVERQVSRNRRNKRKHTRQKPALRLALTKPTTAAGTDTNTQTTNPTTTATDTNSPANSVTTAASPSATTGTGASGTNIDDGSGSGTSSTSTTSTGNKGAINCVVVQRPT